MGTLVDLHVHLGSSVAPHILWSIAHEQGYKPPVKDYREFVRLVTADRNTVRNLDDYLRIMHDWTEKIQSSPAAVERSTYEMVCEEYRRADVDTIEVRFNPMKRNGGGERDLDYIISAAVRGLERACQEYPVKAGLIFCMAREFPLELNTIIVDKAIKYAGRGVVGIDLAGPERLGYGPGIREYSELFQRAASSGLGTTVHCGETGDPNAVIEAVEYLRPHRVGHGIAAWKSEDALRCLSATGTVLELCLTSNLMTRAVSGLSEFNEAVHTFIDSGVTITFNSDGTYLLDTDMKREVSMLVKHNILSESDVPHFMSVARSHSFIR